MLSTSECNMHSGNIFINEITLCCPPLSAICIQETWLHEHDDTAVYHYLI